MTDVKFAREQIIVPQKNQNTTPAKRLKGVAGINTNGRIVYIKINKNTQRNTCSLI